MFPHPLQICTTAHYFSKPFLETGRNVFTLLCSRHFWLMVLIPLYSEDTNIWYWVCWYLSVLKTIFKRRNTTRRSQRRTKQQTKPNSYKKAKSGILFPSSLSSLGVAERPFIKQLRGKETKATRLSSRNRSGARQKYTQFRLYGLRIYVFSGYTDYILSRFRLYGLQINRLFAYMDHFSRDKRGPCIRNWLY